MKISNMTLPQLVQKLQGEPQFKNSFILYLKTYKTECHTDADFESLRQLIKSVGDLSLIEYHIKKDTEAHSKLLKVALEGIKGRELIKTSGDLATLGRDFPNEKNFIMNFMRENKFLKNVLITKQDNVLISKIFGPLDDVIPTVDNLQLAKDFSFGNKTKKEDLPSVLEMDSSTKGITSQF